MKLILKPTILFCSLFFFNLMGINQLPLSSNQVDILVFSYDRPLQLHALLSSLYSLGSGFGNVFVLYKTSTARFANAYNELINEFPHTIFIAEENTLNDFHDKTYTLIKNSPNNYIAFAVDDIIIIDHIDFEYCATLLEKTQAHGFFLRLGKNITHCFINKMNGQPPLTSVADQVVSWNFCSGTPGDWACFNSLDLTILHKKIILPALKDRMYHHPNSLEYALHHPYPHITTSPTYMAPSKLGLCFIQSKLINIPLNTVENPQSSAESLKISTDYLLDLFEGGGRIDIESLFQFKTNSPHILYNPGLKYPTEKLSALEKKPCSL